MTESETAAPSDGLAEFERLLGGLGIGTTVVGKPGDIDVLVSSVNVQRLSNFPLSLTPEIMGEIYSDIVLENVCGYDYVGETNVVDVYIRFLRSKIDEVFGVKMIQTVRGVGYVIKSE